MNKIKIRFENNQNGTQLTFELLFMIHLDQCGELSAINNYLAFQTMKHSGTCEVNGLNEITIETL
jgi:hypothetical protein